MKISVITINYNNKCGLADTIASVIDQTSTSIEYIVVDGGSEDGSLDVIKCNSERIHHWVSETDGGIYNAMNKGILRATGEYCIFMNSGDVFHDQKVIENVIPHLDGTAIVNGDTLYPSGKYDRSPAEISLGFFMQSTIIHQSTFIRTDLLKNNNYDEKYKIVSDWKFWIEELILKNVSYKSIHIPISIFDQNGIGSTNILLHDHEMQLVLKELFSERILKEYEWFLNGRTWEDKMYIEIKHSKLHRILYTINACLIKLLTAFAVNSVWAKKYPLFLPK